MKLYIVSNGMKTIEKRIARVYDEFIKNYGMNDSSWHMDGILYEYRSELRIHHLMRNGLFFENTIVSVDDEPPMAQVYKGYTKHKLSVQEAWEYCYVNCIMNKIESSWWRWRF